MLLIQNDHINKQRNNINLTSLLFPYNSFLDFVKNIPGVLHTSWIFPRGAALLSTPGSQGPVLLMLTTHSIQHVYVDYMTTGVDKMGGGGGGHTHGGHAPLCRWESKNKHALHIIYP